MQLSATFPRPYPESHRSEFGGGYETPAIHGAPRNMLHPESFPRRSGSLTQLTHNYFTRGAEGLSAVSPRYCGLVCLGLTASLTLPQITPCLLLARQRRQRRYDSARPQSSTPSHRSGCYHPSAACGIPRYEQCYYYYQTTLPAPVTLTKERKTNLRAILPCQACFASYPHLHLTRERMCNFYTD